MYICKIRFLLLFLHGISLATSQSKNPADLTLLIKTTADNKFTLKCIATGSETLSYGMTWVFDNSSEYLKKSAVSNYTKLIGIDNFNDNKYLTKDYENAILKSLVTNLPPVIDHRWEGFKIRNSKFVINENVSVINLSILLNGNEDVNIIIESNNTKQKVKYRSNSNNRENSELITKWHHITIYYNGTDYNYQSIDEYVYQSDRPTFYVSALSVTGEKDLVWKSHEYSFLKIPETNGDLKIFVQKIRIIANDTGCVSFFLFTEELCEVSITLEPGDKKMQTKKYTTYGKWIEYKIINFKTPSEIVYFSLSVRKPSACFAAIDDIRHCSLNETRILSLKTYTKSIPCVSLSSPEHPVRYKTPKKPKDFIQNVENIGRLNNVSCEYLGEKQYCNRNTICDKDKCYCASGFHGLNCSTACANDKWGINCEEKCNCSKKCDKHVGCPICMEGIINSSCRIPNINGTIGQIYATSISFSLKGTEKFNMTDIRCNNTKFNASINYAYLYNLEPNTHYTLKCKFCHLNNCSDDIVLENFTTKQCSGLQENNIVRSIYNGSISLNITGLDFNQCPASMYEVRLEGKNDTIEMKNETTIPDLEENTLYEIQIKRINASESLIRFNVTTDYSIPNQPKSVKRNDNNCFTIVPPEKGVITNFTFISKAMNKNCESNSMNQTEEEITKKNKEHCFNLKNYQFLEVIVRANNEKGNGKSLSEKFETPATDVLTDDDRLFKISVNGTNIKPIFPACEKTGGPLFYKIVSKCLEEWCKDDREKAVYLEYGKPEQFVKYIIEPSVRFANHSIIVYISRSNDTLNEYNNSTFITTPPGKPNKITNFDSYSWENNTLFVRWKPPYPPTGEIESYEVQYGRDNGEMRWKKGNLWHECVLWTDFVCANITTDIAVNLTYNITVKSKNKKVDDFSVYSTVMNITEKAPGKPELFKATRTQNCDIELEWGHPDIPNGRIQYFFITIYENSKNISSERVNVRYSQRYSHNLTKDLSGHYSISIRAHNEHEGKESATVKVTSCTKSSTSAILISLSVIVILSVIICAAVFIYFKIRNHKKSVSNRDSAELIPMLRPSTCLHKTELKHFLSKVCNESYENVLKKQFEILSDHQFTSSQEVGTLPEHRLKNRYKNIIPYDYTRVVLNGSDGSDYINANYVHNSIGENAYIAAQCPKKETVHDFYRMIWQERVQIIVCLATVSEGEKKIFQYWPEDYIHVQYEDFMVYHKSNHVETDFVVKHLEIEKDSERRDILFLNFISWPDHSIPLFPLSLYQFLQYAQDLRANFNTGPTVVHCSAGIGRTGTYIMCDRLIRADGDRIDIPECLKDIRKCRPSMVSRESQYKLIYFILDEHFNGEYINIQKADLFNLPPNKIDEFLLKYHKYTLDRQYAYDMLHSEIISENSTISEMPSIFVDGYQGERKFITVSLQQKNSNHIWWTIDQYDVKTVLVLQSKGLNLFWPTDIQEKKVESFTINLENCTDLDDCIIYNLKYTKSREFKTVQVFYYNNWNSNANQPTNIISFLKFYSMYKQLDAEENMHVMLCCQNGSQACGVFITLDLVIRKMETDRVFNICWAVLGIRQHNKSFMGDLEQFKFVYKMVKYYMENRENVERGYENIPQLQDEPIYENTK